MSEHVTFLNEFDREIQVPAEEVDLISRLQRSGLRTVGNLNKLRKAVHLSASPTSSITPKHRVVESYRKPEFEFVAVYDSVITRIISECATEADHPKDATEFRMLGEDIPELSEMKESEYVRCWAYFQTREKWRKENVDNY